MADHLDRTYEAVRNRVRLLGIRLDKTSWQNKELDVLQSASPNTSTQELANILGRSVFAVRGKLRELGISRDPHIFRRRYSVDDTAFSTWNEQAAYWIGFIAADGSLRKAKGNERLIAIELAEQDAEHLGRLKVFLNSSHAVRLHSGKATLCFSSNGLYEQLIKLGITPNKTHKLTFPDVPDAHVQHFIRGYFDGDGSAGLSSKGELFFSLLGTEPFLKGVIATLPVDNVPIQKRSDCQIYRIQLFGRRAATIIRWMYYNASIYLPRKRDKLLSVLA